MIKKNHNFNKNTKFGRLPVVDKKKIIMMSPKKKRLISQTEKRWKSIVNLNCKSAEFNDINGIDFFYRVFHHDPNNKDKLKDIINDINNDNNDNNEKMITGKHLLGFTPILYKLTKQMIKENTKQYRKFQLENNSLNKKNFKNWWSSAHLSTFSNTGIGKILLNLRKFWAVFFSSFKNIKNFEKFEKRILAGNDKLSKDYTSYVKTLSDYGVPKFIDYQSISSTHYDNNIKVFTDFSVFSELWRLNKPIFCSYRTLFIECSSGIKEMDKCPFNNWDKFNFDKLSEQDLEEITKYVGDLVTQNSENSIVGHINTGADWKQDEMNRMFERDNPTDRARLLETAKSVAAKTKHSHGIDGSKDHTHSINPIYNNSERFLEDKIRSDSQMINAHSRVYGRNGVNIEDADLPSVLGGNTERFRKKILLQESQEKKKKS